MPVRKAIPVKTKAAHRLFDQTEMRLEPREEGGERPDRERGEQKRHAEADRIDRQHAGAFDDRCFRCCDREDGGEDRADARRQRARK